MASIPSSTSWPNVVATIFAYIFAGVWSAGASTCSEEDSGQCPNHVNDSSVGHMLLQSRRQTERGHATEHEHLQKKVERIQHLAFRMHRNRDTEPCSCQASGSEWVRPAPREPRCLFIDLGAADGNTFQNFINDGYGPVQNCPSNGAYEAILVEANPIFSDRLIDVQKSHAGNVRVMPSTAAYMCEGTTSFYLDTVDAQENFWGSSLSSNTNDVKRSGQQEVSVPMVNVARLILENALPEDYVIVKMDIEGAEWDIVPCMAKSEDAAHLIDALYIERHPQEWSLVGTDEASYHNAIQGLNQLGVGTPEYDSPTL